MTRWWIERIKLKIYYTINTLHLIEEQRGVKEWETEKGSEINK